jgi:hypothetical protein
MASELLQRDLLTVDEVADLLGVDFERRSSPRFAYQVSQRIAPLDSDNPRAPLSFQDVLCKDLSMGGLSFYLAEQPTFEYVIIQLGRASQHINARAEVCGCMPIPELRPYWLVRCRFVDRISPAELGVVR